MTELLTRFSLEAVKFDWQMMACLVVIWSLVLGCAISSIVTQPSLSRKQRIVWIVLVVGLPGFGLLAYLPFSISKDSYPGLFNFRRH